MEGIFQWAKSITCYLLFVSLLSYLMPAGKYEQYLKLFFGAVFILLVIRPLSGGLHIDAGLARDYERIRFTQEQEEFQQKLWGMEEERMNQIMEQYEEAVNQDIRAMADEEGFCCILAGARIEGREEEENFGQVTEIVMVIGPGGGMEEAEEGSIAERKSIVGGGEDAGGGKGIKENGAEDEREGEPAGKTVSIDQVQVVLGEEGKGSQDLGWEEKNAEQEGQKEAGGNWGQEGKEKAGGNREQERGDKKDAGGKITREAVDEFQRKVARYYGLEEEAVRITWKDN